jgi:hypothetical protein
MRQAGLPLNGQYLAAEYAEEGRNTTESAFRFLGARQAAIGFATHHQDCRSFQRYAALSFSRTLRPKRN